MWREDIIRRGGKAAKSVSNEVFVPWTAYDIGGQLEKFYSCIECIFEIKQVDLCHVFHRQLEITVAGEPCFHSVRVINIIQRLN